MVGDIVRKKWNFVQLIIKSNNELKMTTNEKCTCRQSKLALLSRAIWLVPKPLVVP